MGDWSPDACGSIRLPVTSIREEVVSAFGAIRRLKAKGNRGSKNKTTGLGHPTFADGLSHDRGNGLKSMLMSNPLSRSFRALSGLAASFSKILFFGPDGMNITIFLGILSTPFSLRIIRLF